MKLFLKISVLIFIVFCLCNFTAKAQEKNKEDSLPSSFLILKFSPTNLVDPLASSIQFGLEHSLLKISDNMILAMQYELGKINGIEFGTDSRLKGWRARAESRIYTNAGNDDLFPGTYLGLDFFFIDAYFNKDNYVMQYYTSNNSDVYYYRWQEEEINKKVYGWHLKFGIQHQLKGTTVLKNVMFDWYCGVGFRVRDYSSTPVGDVAQRTYVNYGYTAYKYNSKSSSPSIMLGFKIGYMVFAN